MRVDKTADDVDLSTSFTIVIPTLQRSPLLTELVTLLGSSPLVDELLIINNATEPCAFEHSKCRVLNMPKNIYVNPAWNLGAREARTGLIGLVNDDVLFDPQMLRPIARRLTRGAGIIRPATACVRDMGAPRPRLPRRPLFVPAYERPFAFDTAMFLRREDYTPHTGRPQGVARRRLPVPSADQAQPHDVRHRRPHPHEHHLRGSSV